MELEFEIIESGYAQFWIYVAVGGGDLESILPAGVLKIVLQHNRGISGTVASGPDPTS